MGETMVLAREETGRGEVALRRRLDDAGCPIYEIIFNGVFLMASTNAHSARQLACLGLEPLRRRAGLRVLIGGLGMGYTLQAALAHPGVAQVEVVEVEPLIVQWNRQHFGPLNGEALADERVEVVVADLTAHLQATGGRYDAILLDIDNGPTWLVLEENVAVYERPALGRMRELLAPGGVLAVWAAEPAPCFAAGLVQEFGGVDELPVAEEVEGRRTEYVIYRARAALPPARGGAAAAT